ncbi:MAG: addiction module protein [Candidatus Hydrogenedentes bacterium]|nr:addiction module protein [Candidatus Hydrogenedentota bacterium]
MAAENEVKLGIDVASKESHVSREELVTEIAKLTLQERAALAKWLVESLDALSESEIEALWVDAAERRLDELEQDLATEIPSDEVLRVSAESAGGQRLRACGVSVEHGVHGERHGAARRSGL